jgi:hypothetical protein
MHIKGTKAKVASSNLINGQVHLIQHYVKHFVSHLRQVGGFLRVLRFPPPIKQLTAMWDEQLACIFQVHKKCNTEGGLDFRCTLCNDISTIFQLYHGGQLFYWWRKSEDP